MKNSINIQMMKYNNTIKCASGHGENKPSLAKWKFHLLQ